MMGPFLAGLAFGAAGVVVAGAVLVWWGTRDLDDQGEVMRDE